MVRRGRREGLIDEVMNQPPGVLVFDQSEFFRRQMVGFLSELDRYMIYEAGYLKQASQVISNMEVDIIILDIMMSDANGIDIIKKIQEQIGEKFFIVVSSFRSERIILEAIKSGIVDFLFKPLNKEIFIQSILKVQTRVERRRFYD